MADKLPAPQYNRPTTKARPQDPRRFESHDVQSADGQQDPEYRKMVQDIEALQHRQGWLAGRGAFDKDDLLYLKRKEEEERLKEQEQRNSETTAFAAARARAAMQQQETAKASLKHSLQQTSRQQYKTVAPLQPLLKVKSHGKDARLQQIHEQPAGSPTAKRPRLEGVTIPSAAEIAHDGQATKPIHSTDKQPQAPQHVVSSATGAAVQQVHHAVGNTTHEAATAAVPPTAVAKHEANGLAGFLGGYGSDDDQDSDSNSRGILVDHLDSRAAEPPSNVVTQQLPSAAEVLHYELPNGGFAAAHQQQQQALAHTSQGSDDVSSDERPGYHQHGEWI